MSSQAIITQQPGKENLFKKTAEAMASQALVYEKIETPERYTEAAKLFRDFAGAVKRTKAHYDPKIADARVPYQNLLNEKSDILEILDSAKSKLGKSLLSYEEAAKQAAKAEQERIEKEQQAAQERERQAAIAKEEEDRIAKAEELQAAGKGEEALKMLEEPVVVEEFHSFTPATVVTPNIPKVSGFIGKTKYKARLNPTGSGVKYPTSVSEELQAKAKMEVIKAVAEGRIPVLAIDLNMSFINTQANHFRELLGWPGLETFEDKTFAGRG